jgi:hypothetical protein
MRRTGTRPGFEWRARSGSGSYDLAEPWRRHERCLVGFVLFRLDRGRRRLNHGAGWSRRRRRPRGRVNDRRCVAVAHFRSGRERRAVFDEPELEMADLDDVARPKRALGDLGAVHEDPVAAAQIADDDAIVACDEFGMAARQQGVGVADVAQGIAPDNDFSDEQQLALAAPVIDNEFSAQRFTPARLKPSRDDVSPG